MPAEIIVASLPFLFAAMLQALKPGVRGYAQRAGRWVWDEEVRSDSAVLKRGVELATHVYLQLSFIFGVLIASIACFVYTIMSRVPLLAVVAGVVLLSVVPTWLFKWQGLSARELEGAKGRPMRIVGWVAILLQWGVTIVVILLGQRGGPCG